MDSWGDRGKDGGETDRQNFSMSFCFFLYFFSFLFLPELRLLPLSSSSSSLSSELLLAPVLLGLEVRLIFSNRAIVEVLSGRYAWRRYCRTELKISSGVFVVGAGFGGFVLAGFAWLAGFAGFRA